MRHPPRPRAAALLTGRLVWHIALVSVLFLAAGFGVFFYALDRGYSLMLAQTIAMNTLVVLELFHLFFIRNIHGTSLTWRAVRGTPVIWACIAVVVGAQLAITYLPPLQGVFGTQAVPWPHPVSPRIIMKESTQTHSRGNTQGSPPPCGRRDVNGLSFH